MLTKINDKIIDENGNAIAHLINLDDEICVNVFYYNGIQCLSITEGISDEDHTSIIYNNQSIGIELFPPYTYTFVLIDNILYIHSVRTKEGIELNINYVQEVLNHFPLYHSKLD